MSEFLASLKSFPVPVGRVILHKKLSRCRFGIEIRNPELRSRPLSTAHTKRKYLKRRHEDGFSAHLPKEDA